MSDRSITVGGLPGTGTSTLCRILESETGLPYTYAGRLFRDEAKSRGMSLEEFGALCEADDRVDRALDDQQRELLRGDPLILEGRLSGWLAQQENVPALKVWLMCATPQRIKRIMERDGEDVEQTMARVQEREASERARYQHYYGIDLGDQRPYDLILDSTDASPEQLAAAVIAAWQTPEEVPH